MNQARVTALMAGHDATLEVSDELLNLPLPMVLSVLPI